MEAIKFYKVSEPFGNFSNFAPFPIFVDGEIWLTVEHYFQANKFEDLSAREKIKSLKTAIEAAREGRDKKNILRPDWEHVKERIMMNALMAKFLQHPILKKELLGTGNAIIIEHTINDSYWADGGDGTGKNRLGELLMLVRADIRNISDDEDIVFPPWIAFPHTDYHDLFWRMGLGEEYLYKWAQYYLNCSDKISYEFMFPAPSDWKEVYD